MAQDLVERARALAATGEVGQAVDLAREACGRLRLHPVTRRRASEGTAEAQVRGARASALLDGAELPIGQVRSLAGAHAIPGRLVDDDPVQALARGALRATVAAGEVSALVTTAPAQALARLHTAATGALLPAHEVGRPRLPGVAARDLGGLGAESPTAEADLARVAALLRAAADVSAVVVAALAHAEIATARPFVLGNGLVARAVERAVLQGRGVDPARLCVPEAGHVGAVGGGYRAALAGYRAGGQEGIVGWVLHCCDAVVRGAVEGSAAGDAVLAGRTTP